MTQELPSYIDRGMLDVAPPPWRCEDIHMYAFYLASNREALQKLCDARLNHPTGGAVDYRPTTDFILLTFQSLKDLHSTAPGHLETSRLDELEAGFWIFVRDHKATENDDRENWACFVPFIFTDNDLAVAAGREIFGFPKQQAAVAAPRWKGPFTVDGLALAPGENGILRKKRILEVTRRRWLSLRGIVRLISEMDERLEHALEHLKIDSGLIELIRAFIDLLRTEQLRFVFNKQIRAVEGGAEAQFRAVTETRQHGITLRDIDLLLGDYRLNLPELVTHPIAEQLGLTFIGESRTVDILLGLSIRLRFDMAAGRCVWVA